MTHKIRKFTIQQNVRRAKRNNPIGRFFSFLGGLPSKFFGRKKRPHKGKSWFRKILSLMPYVISALILAGVIGTLVVYAWVRQDLPDPNKLSDRSVAQTTKIYDRTGENVLYEVYQDQKRTLIELDDISPHIIGATLVAEDRNFYEHKGFMIKGYIRAFIENLKSGHRGQGGSTITQQLVKNALLTSERTYIRKLKELLLSIEIERIFTKDEILKMYLNEIPYGSVSYGIESAADTFLGKNAKNLTLAESALLASLPKGTTLYSPYGTNLDLLIDRQNWILDSMFELGYITFDQAEEAKLTEEDLDKTIKPQTGTLVAPHFIFYVREQLAEELGESLVERGGLKIITTLDYEKQQIAEQAIADNYEALTELNATNAALLSLNPKNGDILAMVGSADYFDDDISGQYNALLGLRQPGSSIKPLVYSTAFEQGYTPETVLFDVVTDFGGGYEPRNHDLSEHGPVTVREALAGSLNIPAVKMLYLAGIDDVIAKASELGYTTLNDRDRFGLSLALGGGEVKPMEHISSFAAYANDGELVPTRTVLKVEDKNGNVLIDNTEAKINPERVLEEQTARQLTSILSDNSARAYVFGENSYLQLGDRPIAAKTGTTNSYKDAWTVGYTPSLVTGVWVGNADGDEMNQGAGGSRVAAPIWNAYMRNSLVGMPWEEFTPPEPIEEELKPILSGNKESQVILKIDTITGLLATEYTPEDLIEEKGFGIPHSILYFVDKKDPRGPEPKNPADDPQFKRWEEAVTRWIGEQEYMEDIELEIDPPPTEKDNVHTLENKPRVTIRRPYRGAEVTSRDMFVELDAYAKRGITQVVFAINGDTFAMIDSAPFNNMIIPIPNRFPRGYHTLLVTVYDDVKNRATTDITINLTADAGPIGTEWITPTNLQTIYRYQFPFNVRFGITDNKSVERLEISARHLSNGTEDIIGTIENPPLPNMSIQWSEEPLPGRYSLRLTATLSGGERKVEEILVEIR